MTMLADAAQAFVLGAVICGVLALPAVGAARLVRRGASVLVRQVREHRQQPATRAADTIEDTF